MKRCRRSVIATGLFLQTIFLFGQNKESWPQPTPDSSRAEILAELREYYADLTARNWKNFEQHFWPGATLTTVWQLPKEQAPRVDIIPLKTFIAQTPEGPDSKPIFDESMLDADVRAQKNLAHVWSKYVAHFGDPGKVMEWKGVDAFTLIKHEGKWKIVSLSYTDIE